MKFSAAGKNILLDLKKKLKRSSKKMSGFLENVDFYVKQYLTEKMRLEDYEDKGNYDDYDEWFTDVFIDETLDQWDNGGYNFYHDMDINEMNITAEELCEMLRYIFGVIDNLYLEYTVENIVNSYVYCYVSNNDKFIELMKEELDLNEEDSDDEEDILRCEKCGYEDYKNDDDEWTEVLTHLESDKVFCKSCMPCDKKSKINCFYCDEEKECRNRCGLVPICDECN